MKRNFEADVQSFCRRKPVPTLLPCASLSWIWSLTLSRAHDGEAISARNKPSERGGVFHGIEPPGSWNHKPIRRRQIVRLRPAIGCVVHKNVEYTAKKFQKSWQGRVQSWR